MKGRDRVGSTLPNLSLNSLNVSTRVGIPQSSFNKFNKTMLQLNNQTTINKNLEEKKLIASPSQVSQQSNENQNNDHFFLSNNKEKHKKNALIMVNIQANTLSEYKYVPPRRPRYIRCINHQNLNSKQNLSQSLPAYKNVNKVFDEKSSINTHSNNDECEDPAHPHLVQFGDPSDCYCKIVSYPRTPALPLRMKIKMNARDAESNGNQEQMISDAFNNSHENENGTLNDSKDYITENENSKAETGLRSNYDNENIHLKKPKDKNVQCMALKYFGESGNLIGCFSTKIPVRFPVSERDKIKNRLRNSYPNPQPIPPNSSPRSIQSKNHFSSFISLC